MQITFDNLDELKAFIHAFVPNSAATHTVHNGDESATVVEAPLAALSKPATRGRKPLALVAIEPKPAKVTRPRGEVSLTDRIRKAIQNHIDHGKEFSANDIYAVILKKDKEVNKQSVITSVLKQMNSDAYAHIPRKERKGAGPRPVKVYTP
jgi:hypothetical protein